MDPLDSISNSLNAGTQDHTNDGSWATYDATFRNSMFKQLQEEIKQLEAEHKQNQKRDKEIEGLGQ